jgi:hypothetical protein
LTIYGWTAFWLPTVGNDDFDSNYRQGWAGWYAANAAVHTEAMGRLVGGPSFIARDRPICIFQHFARIGIDISGFVKVGFEQYWGAYDRDYQEVVGIGRIPRADIRPRTYRVDWYLRATGAATAGADAMHLDEFMGDKATTPEQYAPRRRPSTPHL